MVRNYENYDMQLLLKEDEYSETEKKIIKYLTDELQK